MRKHYFEYGVKFRLIVKREVHCRVAIHVIIPRMMLICNIWGYRGRFEGVGTRGREGKGEKGDMKCERGEPRQMKGNNPIPPHRAQTLFLTILLWTTGGMAWIH